MAQQTVACAVHEALDLEPPRRERHRAVEHGDLPRLPAVQLAGEREHGAAAERDDDRAGPQALERDRARPVERRLALEEADLGLAGTRSATSGSASTAPSRRMCRYSPASSSRVQAEPRSLSSAHCTSSSTSTSPESGAISAVQQMIGACSLTRSSPVTRPTRSAPSWALRRRCASWASIRSGAAKTPRPVSARNSSAACVLPEFVGPTCATTVSGSVRRNGRTISGSGTRRCASRRWPGAGRGSAASGGRGAPGGRPLGPRPGGSGAA